MFNTRLLFLLSGTGVFLLFLLIILAVIRSRRISRAELRAFKDLSRDSGLAYHPANLIRGAVLLGNWHGRATGVTLGMGGLTIRMNLRSALAQLPAKERRSNRNRKPFFERRREEPGAAPIAGRAIIKFPAGARSPTWGISSEIESNYHLTGDRVFLEHLARAFSRVEELRDLSGEFKLIFELRIGKTKTESADPVRKSGRMTFQTSIAISSPDQLRRLLESMSGLAEHVEEQ